MSIQYVSFVHIDFERLSSFASESPSMAFAFIHAMPPWPSSWSMNVNGIPVRVLPETRCQPLVLSQECARTLRTVSLIDTSNVQRRPGSASQRSLPPSAFITSSAMATARGSDVAVSARAALAGNAHSTKSAMRMRFTDDSFAKASVRGPAGQVETLAAVETLPGIRRGPERPADRVVASAPWARNAHALGGRLGLWR